MGVSKRALVIVISFVAILSATYFVVLSSIESSVGDYTFRIEHGLGVSGVASKLKEEGVVKSKLLFYIADFVYGTNGPIKPGAYKLSSGMSLKEIVTTLHSQPWARFVTIPPNVTKEKIGEVFAEEMGWGALDKQFFANTYAGMQWQRYHDFLQNVFEKEFEWNKTKKETFLSLSALYYDKEFDFLKNAYKAGTYEIPVGSSRAQVAGILIDQYGEQFGDNEELGVVKSLDETAMYNVAQLIEEEMELMPDIVALPALDVTLKKQGSRTLLAFTTSYWNKGRGPLELIADPKTRGRKEDIERNVYQRIYRLDGDYRERMSGTFLWHQAHLHYHFTDFAIYELEAVDIGDAEFKEGVHQKSTFCIRDSEPIDLTHPGSQKGASYSICGKERQGISPGWADSYYYTYIDQTFDVTNVPKGTYIVRIIVNPKDRFDEITKENNISETVISLDVENNKVEVLEEREFGK